MKITLVVAGILALSGGAAAQEVTPKALEGVWVGARFTEGRGEDMKKGVALIITFKDNMLAVQKKSRALVGKATFTLSAGGKQIDATGISGGYRRKVYLGVIKIQGDTLYWNSCGTAGKNSKRPGGFTANPGSAHYLIVAKKQG